MSAAIASRRKPSRMASAMYGSSSTINTRMLQMVRPGAYRRRIENQIRAGNTTLPSMEAWPIANQHEQRPAGFGFAGSLSLVCQSLRVASPTGDGWSYPDKDLAVEVGA